jgi:hypothetical protein
MLLRGVFLGACRKAGLDASVKSFKVGAFCLTQNLRMRQALFGAFRRAEGSAKEDHPP